MRGYAPSHGTRRATLIQLSCSTVTVAEMSNPRMATGAAAVAAGSVALIAAAQGVVFDAAAGAVCVVSLGVLARAAFRAAADAGARARRQR